MRRLTILLCVVLPAVFGTAGRAGAQERNAARLTQEDTTYVDVSMGLAGQAGALKDLFELDWQAGGALEAQARRTLGAAHLYGRFGYGYDYGRGSTWRGWIDPYETPFMLADSIPGPLSLERYSMEAGIGLPLGGGWAAGLDVAYDVALMAKHRDLRNKNTGMTFRVAPGIGWQGGSFGLGLDLGYERATERVEYMQVSSNVENVLFDIYGLWVGRAMGFSSAENRRMKEGDRFFGDFQLDFSLGGVSVSNNLGLSWQRSVQTEVGYNNLQFGETRSWTWNDELDIRIGDAHGIEASATYSTQQGFRPLQRQELDPDSRIRIWVTYGDPVFCYWRRQHEEHLKYTFGTDWKVSVGVDNEGLLHSYTEYPHRFVQGISSVTPSVGAAVPLGSRLELAPWVAFSKAYGQVNELTEWQLSEPMMRQWDYWDGDNWLAALELQWSTATGGTYVKARYDFMANDTFSSFRHAASLKIGFVF